MNENYDDAEWQRLYQATLQILNISEKDALKAYAEVFVLDAKKRWGMWFQMSKTSYEFLLRQPAIHNGFATGLADKALRKKINDKFRIDMKDKMIIVHYISPNQHCKFYEALANYIAKDYSDRIELTHKKCLKSGDNECEMHVKWLSIKNE